jgi:hypothetical protein
MSLQSFNKMQSESIIPILKMETNCPFECIKTQWEKAFNGRDMKKKNWTKNNNSTLNKFDHRPMSKHVIKLTFSSWQ